MSLFKCTKSILSAQLEEKRCQRSPQNTQNQNKYFFNTILDRQHLHVQFVGFYLIIIFYISQMGYKLF